jgi:hypothetical protein
MNSVYFYILYRERKSCKEGKALAVTGGVGGLIVGVCPLCVTGIVPLVLGFFGIGFSLASLPFQGIEVQALIVAVLLAGVYFLRKQNF